MSRLRTSHCDQISVSSSGSSGSDTDDLSVPQPSRLRLKLKVRAPALFQIPTRNVSRPLTKSLLLSPQSLPGSLHNVAEDSSISSSASSSPRLSRSSCSSSHPDLRSSSLVLSPESSSSSSQSGCSPPAAQPVYNKQVADSCIIRVSVECVDNGSVYKSILVRFQKRRTSAEAAGNRLHFYSFIKTKHLYNYFKQCVKII